MSIEIIAIIAITFIVAIFLFITNKYLGVKEEARQRSIQACVSYNYSGGNR